MTLNQGFYNLFTIKSLRDVLKKKCRNNFPSTSGTLGVISKEVAPAPSTLLDGVGDLRATHGRCASAVLMFRRKTRDPVEEFGSLQRIASYVFASTINIHKLC